MMHISVHGRRITIADKKPNMVLPDECGKIIAALFTAWRIEDASIARWEAFVQALLNRGCSYFICVGEYSEELHDALDDFLESIDGFYGKDKQVILTTFHTDESAEDVANFFLHGVIEENPSESCQVAVLNEESKFDSELREILLLS